MKKPYLILTLFTAILFAACSDDSNNATPPRKLTATVNGQAWMADHASISFKYGTDTAVFYGFVVPENPALLRETLRIWLKGTGTGSYQVIKSRTGYVLSPDGATASKDYRPIDSYPQSFKITSLNNKTGVVTGEFNLGLTNSLAPAGTTDRLNFTNGKFTAYVAPLD